ncbi:hypothetical protein Acid345_2150 [Candidatus Koribacter versatilis Ellin345]|uniref:DUF4112 domain-containing protein n=1 Tax=Koribacter versatilis (strain Ellin345) TaxID=204669 RepID=Q1IPP9_KORVE|nr:DUF4112 domain-containing protein [Candidatus Koribacter versatilis]ABF41151.1 hypothetical protein Acid345_2150 [Candidatus Koribacter versatilis Ellin345]
MRSQMPEPEIIPPGESPRPHRDMLSDETLALLASLLDDLFRIPGTPIRFGLDPLIGLLPGVGDLITGAASFLIILAGWQRNLPRVTLVRMVTNVVIDTLVGSIPVAGDMFDVAWKSNRKNLTLLQRSSASASRRQTWKDWAFLLGIVFALATVIVVPIVIVTLLFHALWERH